MSYVDYPSDLYPCNDLLNIVIDCDLAEEESTDGTNKNVYKFHQYTVTNSDLLGKMLDENKTELFGLVEKYFNDVIIGDLRKAISMYDAGLSEEARKNFQRYLDYIKYRNGSKTVFRLILTFNHVPDIVHRLQINSSAPIPKNQCGDFIVNIETQVNAIFECGDDNGVNTPNARFNERLVEISHNIKMMVVDKLTDIYFPGTYR